MSTIFAYETVPGLFFETDKNIQEEAQIPPRFGLIDSSPMRWKTLKDRLLDLNKAAPKGTTYRVIFIGRHGEGYHNVAEREYGTIEWNRHQAKLNGDENMTWGPDPELTELGIQQALAVNSAWRTEIAYGIPLPESLYTSPLNRAMRTALLSFDGILIDIANPSKMRPLIKEKLREVNGVHRCDMRSPRSRITKMFPHFDIEPGFTEEDELWSKDHRETEEELTVRLRQALDEIFSKETATYVSITAHGGAIRALLRVVNATHGELPTGGVVSLVLKVTSTADLN